MLCRDLAFMQRPSKSAQLAGLPSAANSARACSKYHGKYNLQQPCWLSERERGGGEEGKG